MSALGGMGVHAMSFAGPDILPEANPGGTEVWLEESNEVGQTPTNWVSHPSGIGYRRSSPGIITTTGSGSSASASQGPPLPGNAPSMDTGLSDGGTSAELTRLSNFNAGGNENPTAMQPGPISRAEQVGEGPLRANLGNEMNVGGYVGYGLLQDLGLIPENSDRSSLDPNHIDSSRSGRAGAGERNYGNASEPSPPPADPDAIVGADDGGDGGVWGPPDDGSGRGCEPSRAINESRAVGRLHCRRMEQLLERTDGVFHQRRGGRSRRSA